MKLLFIFLLALLVGCSSSNDFKIKLIGSWEVYSLNGKSDLYKGFVGTTMKFNADGSFSRGDGSKIYLKGTYTIKGKTINMKWNKKQRSSIVTVNNTELYFEKDMSFSSGDIPMKSVYRKK